jgi:hypothetical protein
MYWKTPHLVKVYESLSAVADNRIVIISETKAKCTSTSGNKYYDIHFDLNTGATMSNDNSAYYTDTLSYPLIALLMITNRLDYDKDLLQYFKNIFWKDINQKFKNDYDKAIDYVLAEFVIKNYPVEKIKNKINLIYKNVCALKIKQLGPKQTPPSAY